MSSIKLNHLRCRWFMDFFGRARSGFFTICSAIIVLRAIVDTLYLSSLAIEEMPSVSQLHFMRHAAKVKQNSRSTLQYEKGSTTGSPSQYSSRCSGDDTFQYDTDFDKGDLSEKSYNKTSSSPRHCCQLCEVTELCTHWSYTSHDSSCWLKNSPTAVKVKANVTSGRVVLSKFVERRRGGSLTQKKFLCTWDPEDAAIFDSTNASGSVPLSPGSVPISAKRSVNTSAAGLLHTVSQEPARPRERHRSYIVINEPRSGSSWLQEVSQMHPGVKVQFELDLDRGDDALACKQCQRPWAPNSKNLQRLPRKLHPPLACGMTIFGSNNHFGQVSALAARHNASLVIVLRKNHLAHAVSAYRHFNTPKMKPGSPIPNIMVPWNAHQLRYAMEDWQQAYDRLLQFPVETGRPAHLIFYEDLKRQPEEVWHEMQVFLGLPPVQLDNISKLEKKSSTRPSMAYLTHLHEIQGSLNSSGSAHWRRMVTDPLYDDDMDMSAEFAAICARAPRANISWRLHTCDRGVAVPRSPAAAGEGRGGSLEGGGGMTRMLSRLGLWGFQ